MRKLFILSAAFVAVLAACNREEANAPGRGKEITVEAAIGTMSKVTTTGDAAAFDTGDKIALYAWTGSATSVPAEKVVNGVENTLGTDGKWTPASPMLWADMVTPHYFIGIYPSRTVSNFTADAYTLNPADYEASDLLVAVNTTGLKASENPVSLTFDHMLAKMFVNLTFRNQWATEPTVSAITVTAKKTATVDYLAKALTASGTAAPVALTKDSNAAWSGLQVPQAGVCTITISIEGKDYVFTHTEDIPLAKGKYTTVNLIVGRDKIELGSVSISNWVAGSTIDNGEAQTED
ncbi:MAG: fimbrillin family protein [Bacteroidales bacterium]|nr:fimbrillin family protein [Bacteroidales bacterium]